MIIVRSIEQQYRPERQHDKGRPQQTVVVIGVLRDGGRGKGGKTARPRPARSGRRGSAGLRGEGLLREGTGAGGIGAAGASQA